MIEPGARQCLKFLVKYEEDMSGHCGSAFGTLACGECPASLAYLYVTFLLQLADDLLSRGIS
jgi:predicted metal-binding protein